MDKDDVYEMFFKDKKINKPKSKLKDNKVYHFKNLNESDQQKITKYVKEELVYINYMNEIINTDIHSTSFFFFNEEAVNELVDRASKYADLLNGILDLEETDIDIRVTLIKSTIIKNILDK